MSNGIPRTFCELFKHADFCGVEIPIIQRDFAQGRPSAEDVRTQFLDALYQALDLPAESDQLPLDLDFVYGSIDTRKAGSIFCPLDGQQRLTTLFLLHWYLASHDGKSDDFKAIVCDGQRSRFSYKVRTSSEEFCDALVCATFDMLALPSDAGGKCCVLSKKIMDEPWFFLMWRQDPTILSALNMLDAIHARFKATNGLYQRLIDDKQPAITFQFLDLHKFDLSDELYIKMNARGVPLTPFEAFKAKLEQKVDRLLPGATFDLNGVALSARDYFSHRIDGAWTNVFWDYRDSKTHTFDRQFMNFVRGLALVTYPHGREGSDTTDVNRVIALLFGHDTEYTFFRYDQDNCLTPLFVRNLVGVLDQLTGANGSGIKTFLQDVGYYNETDVFERILRRERLGVLQSEWVQFYGYCSYLLMHRPEEGDQDFYEWMRVVSNLATNTIYPHTDDFRKAFVNVHSLLNAVGTGSVLDYVADPASPVLGFNRQQIREERLKAQLMLKHESWRESIVVAEKHGYFKGQVEFLLKFTGILDRWLETEECGWDDAADEAYRQAFTFYYEKAAAVFADGGLTEFNDGLWERALLSIGDYLLTPGKNTCFLDNRSRDTSWKRLLRGSDQSGEAAEEKREVVKKLLDHIDCGNVTQSLQVVIDGYLKTAATTADNEWRRKIIECPAAIQFCKKRFIRRDPLDECIYLLSGERKSSAHAELTTFHLKTVILDAKLNRGELAPFSSSRYYAVCNETEKPYAFLNWDEKNIALYIQYERGCYTLKLFCRNGALPGPLEARLITELSFQIGQAGEMLRQVQKDDVEKALDQLIASLKEYEKGAVL